MSNSKALLGFLAGAAVGALAGILFAPEKGSDTRKRISDKTGDASDSLKRSLNNFIDGIKHAYSGAKNDAEEMADKAKAKLSGAKHQVENAVSSIKE